MIDKPQIVQTEVRPAAVIRFTIPRREVREVMGPAIAELLALVKEQGIGPAGPVFTHHFRMDPDAFDFEVGVCVDRDVTPAGRVMRGELPAVTVARTIYHGPYEGLGAAWLELDHLIAAEGHTPAPGLWECYVTGPESKREPAEWATELNRPLASINARSRA